MAGRVLMRKQFQKVSRIVQMRTKVVIQLKIQILVKLS